MTDTSAGLPGAAGPAAPAPRIALALAGGGLEGAIYEIGALRALDEAVPGLDLNQLFLYVGVSAGAFITACLANDLTTAQMCRAIVSPEPGEHPFVPETFLTPALRLLRRSGRSLPRLLGEALVEYARGRGDVTLLESLTRLGRALPVAVFDNEPIRAYLEKIYQLKSRTDDFRQLGKRLVIVAAIDTRLKLQLEALGGLPVENPQERAVVNRGWLTFSCVPNDSCATRADSCSPDP